MSHSTEVGNNFLGFTTTSCAPGDNNLSSAEQHQPTDLLTASLQPVHLLLRVEQPPIIRSQTHGISLRFVNNIFITKSADFIKFVSINPSLHDKIDIIRHTPAPIDEITFHIRV